MQIDDDFDAVIDFSEFLFFCVALDSIKPNVEHHSSGPDGAGQSHGQGQGQGKGKGKGANRGHTAITVKSSRSRSREREKDIAMLSRISKDSDDGLLFDPNPEGFTRSAFSDRANASRDRQQNGINPKSVGFAVESTPAPTTANSTDATDDPVRPHPQDAMSQAIQDAKAIAKGWCGACLRRTKQKVQTNHAPPTHHPPPITHHPPPTNLRRPSNS